MTHISAERRKRPPWVAALKRFEQPDTRKAALQIADTLIPYLALLAFTFIISVPASPTTIWRAA